ncbi:MAG: hypothetical protein ABI461_00280 [Polyangiaceae bacterium]
MRKVSQTFASPLVPEWSPDDTSVRTASVRPTALNANEAEDAVSLEGLSTLATVASGIAHEVNNPLAYVLTNLDFVREQLGNDHGSEIAEALEEARLGALQIATIVRNLQVVVANEARVIDIGQIVESACMIVQSEVTDGAKILRAHGWAPRITANASRVAYLILKMLTFLSSGNGRLDRSTLRVTSGTDADGCAAVEIVGFYEHCDVPAIEHAIAARGLSALAKDVGASLEADYRDGAISLKLAFPQSTRNSVI